MSRLSKKNQSKKFNEEFKKTVVELFHSGSSVKDLSSEYGITDVTIYRWIKEYTPVSDEGNSLTPKEVSAIQKENLRLKQEIEILKKAMTIFAKK